MTTTTATVDNKTAYWIARKDKYGRPCKYLVQGKTLGVVVTLPKAAEKYFGKNRYLVNDWTKPLFIDGERNEAKVTYHETLSAAKGYLLSVVTPE